MTQDDTVSKKYRHSNALLTEKAIKNHSKRLQKEVKNLDRDISLCEAQNLFSRTLGFNNFHEAKTVLQEKKEELSGINTIHDFYNFIEGIESKTDFIWFFPNGTIQYQPHGAKLEDNISIIPEDYVFSNGDFHSVMALLFSQHDLLNFKELPESDHIIISLHRLVNKDVRRHMSVQLYKKKGEMSSMKFLISYSEVADPHGFWRKYVDVKRLF